MMIYFWVFSKINEINKTNLAEQTKFQLSEIIGIENCFEQEINQRNHALNIWVNMLPLLIT